MNWNVFRKLFATVSTTIFFYHQSKVSTDSWRIYCTWVIYSTIVKTSRRCYQVVSFLRCNIYIYIYIKAPMEGDGKTGIVIYPVSRSVQNFDTMISNIWIPLTHTQVGSDGGIRCRWLFAQGSHKMVICQTHGMYSTGFDHFRWWIW